MTAQQTLMLIIALGLVSINVLVPTLTLLSKDALMSATGPNMEILLLTNVRILAAMGST